MVLNVVAEEGNITVLEGAQSLGRLAGGTFTYRATVTGNRIVAS